VLIRIDGYNYVTPKLEGCKNDVESIKLFLEDKFTNFPASIRCLINEQATKQVIWDTFKQHLSNNEDINKGDVMVFYFSGHDSHVDTPEGWVTQDGKIETICPYDQAPLCPAPESEPSSRAGCKNCAVAM
jgi:Caspase domain